MSSFYEEIPGSDSSSVAYARIGPRTVGLSANQASRGRERSRTPTPPPPPPPPPPMSGAHGANSVTGATGSHDVELLSELSEVRRALDRERKLRLSLEDRIKALEAQLLQQLQQQNVTSNNVIANRNSNPLEDIVDSPSSSHPQPTTIVIQGGQTYSSNHPSHRSITGNNSWHQNIPSTHPVPIPGRVTLQISSSSRPQLADGEGDYLVSEHPVNSSPSSSSTSSTHTVQKTPSIRQNHLAGGRMINSNNNPSPTVTATTSITSLSSIHSTTTATTTTTSRSGGVTVSRIITDNL